jgi:hypothetical protein
VARLGGGHRRRRDWPATRLVFPITSGRAGPKGAWPIRNAPFTALNKIVGHMCEVAHRYSSHLSPTHCKTTQDRDNGAMRIFLTVSVYVVTLLIVSAATAIVTTLALAALQVL